MEERRSVEWLIGQNVADLREQKKPRWSQEKLGSELRRYLGRHLTRKAVSVLEHGGRRLEVEELVALALALDVPLGRLFAARPGQELVFSGGWVSKAQDVLGAGAAAGEHDEAVGRLYALNALHSTGATIRALIREAMRDLERADEWAAALEELPGKAAEEER